MIIENTPYTRAAMALGAAITELGKAKQELKHTLRDFSDEEKHIDTLAYHAQLILAVVKLRSSLNPDPSLEAEAAAPAEPRPVPSRDEDGHCSVCGLLWDCDEGETHECPPGFKVAK